MRTSGTGTTRSVRAAALRAAALVGVLAVALLSGCDNNATSPAPSSGTSSGASSTASPSASAELITVPVYYATDTGTDLKLVREFRALPDAGGPALTAAQAVLAGEPLDPDYTGLWDPAGTVLGIDESSGQIEVDLSAEATTTTTGSAGAELAVQALVYAVTGALQTDEPVRILVEGEPVDELFGVLDVRQPIARADPLSVRLLVQFNDPNEGDVVGSPVAVSGEAAVFEATLPWRVETPDGAVVQAGVTQTAEGQTFSPFSFEVSLEPGEYVVIITEDDPSDGAGGPLQSDSRGFVVQ
ncbi:Gmad2 immunoglobulin-like domain-containing protein [Pengzhenrongella phosphoraccumulans]|uniref:Gmad2 immunoglobulin-like domain-containing protein n=1 Tax=Pengzhenrongella phosphoraccumulans TaxID=3114394 RepID=UPI00388F7DB7